MDRARSGCRVAKAHLARELRVRGGHKCRHFLMADLDISHPVLGLLERDIETSHAIARISINPVQSPFGQSVPNEFADVHRRTPQTRQEGKSYVAKATL